MKKTYINPETEIVEIVIQQMLTSSPVGNTHDEEPDAWGGSRLGYGFDDEE